MIVGGLEIISHRHHGGLWWFDARLKLAATPAALPPHTIPQSATAPVDTHTTFSEERPSVGQDLATRVTLGLWAIYIPNLVVSTGLRVLAWGTGTANTEEGSVPPSWSGNVQGGMFGSDDRMLDPYVVNGTVYGPQDV